MHWSKQTVNAMVTPLIFSLFFASRKYLVFQETKMTIQVFNISAYMVTLTSISTALWLQLKWLNVQWAAMCRKYNGNPFNAFIFLGNCRELWKLPILYRTVKIIRKIIIYFQE